VYTKSRERRVGEKQKYQNAMDGYYFGLAEAQKE
jgi:hypothetical protein